MCINNIFSKKVDLSQATSVLISTRKVHFNKQPLFWNAILSNLAILPFRLETKSLIKCFFYLVLVLVYFRFRQITDDNYWFKNRYKR